MISTLFSHHVRYAKWATQLLLDAATTLTPEELSRDFATADRSVLGTLIHIFRADRIWFARVSGEALENPKDPADESLAALRERWPVLLDRWVDWVDHQSQQDLEKTCIYHDLRGKPWTTPYWQIVLHLVNHQTHHRGQVSGFIRSLGHTPPSLDLARYYRQLE